MFVTHHLKDNVTIEGKKIRAVLKFMPMKKKKGNSYHSSQQTAVSPLNFLYSFSYAVQFQCRLCFACVDSIPIWWGGWLWGKKFAGAYKEFVQCMNSSLIHARRRCKQRSRMPEPKIGKQSSRPSNNVRKRNNRTESILSKIRLNVLRFSSLILAWSHSAAPNFLSTMNLLAKKAGCIRLFS